MKLKIKKGVKGCRVEAERPNHLIPEYLPMSYMDAAEFLFDLKDFLQQDETGRRCLDSVHRRRTREQRHVA